MMKTLIRTHISQIHFYFLILSLLSLTSISEVFAQNQRTMSRKYVPGELILKYEPISRTAASGKTITLEHKEIQTIIEQNFRYRLAKVEPIHTTLVEKMIRENTSEEMVLRKTAVRSNPNSDMAGFNLSRKLLFRFSSSLDMEILAKDVEANKNMFERKGFRLVSVSPNRIYEKQAMPDDPLYHLQWAHEITEVEKAWDVTKGKSEVVIAIIDTGIDILNPDVADKLVAGYDFVDVNKSAYESWELLEGEDYVLQDDDPTDTDGHGTHVAGIAAARGFDGFGVTGVCPDCSIMPIRAGAQFYKIDDENEEDTVLTSWFNNANVSDALYHAVENGADVVNMSFGGEGRTSYQDVLQFAEASGVVLIAAAGNDDKADAFYPAFYQEVLAVGSTNAEDKKSDFSNYGSWVDVSAPGSAILSTYPGDLGASISESSLSINGKDYETTIFTFSGFTAEDGLSGDLMYVGLGREEDLANPNYNWIGLLGNIAYIKRGEITFREKVDRAKAYGAIGVIIFNHEDGSIFGTLGTAKDNPVPVLGLTKEDGEAILASLSTQAQRAVLTVDLLSDMHTYNSGTSMASPYVAGMAGLLLSEEPNLSPAEVKARIKTSVDLLDQLNPPYIGQLGTGRVNVSQVFTAVEPPSAEGEIKIYPNPTSGIFKVDLYTAERGQVRIRLFNLIGSLVQENTYDKNADFWNANLDIGTLSPGVYLLKVEHGSLKEVRKIVKR